MNRPNHRTTKLRKGFARATIFALVAACAATLAPDAPAQSMDPDQARMKELVQRIRRSMREIDALLLKGAQPEKIEQEIAENQKRIEELLKETEQKSQSVIQQLDELVKLAKYEKSGSGGGGQPPPQSEPQGSSGEMPQREKSQDPQELAPQPKPQEGGQKPEPQEKDDQQPGGGDPRSGRPDSTSPDQRDSNRPPPLGPTGEFERADLSGRWGMLPPKDAEDLQRRNAEEFPQRYRQWMELYFRRVNKLPPRER